MKKFILMLLCLSIVLSFAGCDSSKKDLYISESGAEYLLVRDAHGNIVINDNDKLQVYSLNENGKKQKDDSGEYITKFIDFNGQVVIGNVVETAEMRFSLPKNFVADNNNPGYFSYDDVNAEIFISYYGDDPEGHIEGVAKNCEKLLESYGSEVYSYEKYNIDVDGTECTAFRMESSSSEFYNHAYSYFIPYDTGCYYINCIVKTNYAKQIDFDKFITQIELK